ncbi:MAG TPA: uroporphyrinogen decarboxylase [Alphaproteobacteria bacterium]
MTLSLIKTLQSKTCNPPPVWLMRQAGRYLPEYRDLRATTSGFMDAAMTPEVAAEMTLQPIRRYPQLDAAIIFSDILVTPYALGMDLQFRQGEGPWMPALNNVPQELSFDPTKLEPIYEALDIVKKELPEDKALIGFAGSPWTVACYMISGSNHDHFSAAKDWAMNQPQRLTDLLNVLTDATVFYLLEKIRHGVDVIQLFDSWAGLLADHPEQFHKFIITPTQNIIDRIRKWHPYLPIIGFPRQAGTQLLDYAQISGLNGLGLGQDIDPVWAAQHIPSHLALQGNLDPELLVAGGEPMIAQARHIIKSMQDRAFIFNLGHGILQTTPPDHVAQLLSVVKER